MDDNTRQALRARVHGAPALTAAIKWRAWLHPRGLDGRFIEKFSTVDVFAHGDGSGGKLRARVTDLKPEGMYVQYQNNVGKAIPSPDPARFPTFIPSEDIGKHVLEVPKAEARLDMINQPMRGNQPNIASTPDIAPKADLRPKGETLADPSGSAVRFQRSEAMKQWTAKVDEFNKTLDTSKSQNIIGSDPLEPNRPWDEIRAPLDASGVEGMFERINAQMDPRFQQHESFVNRTMQAVDAKQLNVEAMFQDPATGEWHPDVQAYAEDLVARLLDRDIRDNIPREHRALVLGGLPGAGKSSIIERLALNDERNPKWVTLNPDTIKEAMIADGVYPKIDGLSPMESVPGMMHELSSDISKLYTTKAMEMGFNVIHDVTLATPKSASKIKDANDLHGYTADAIFVDVPMEMSAKSQIKRHLSGLNRLRAGTDLRGGRFVPTRVLESSAPTNTDFQSLNAESFDWAKRNRMFRRWAVINNNDYVGEALAVGSGSETLAGRPAELLADPATMPGNFSASVPAPVAAPAPVQMAASLTTQ